MPDPKKISSQRFIRALRSVLDERIPASQHALLRAHYWAPNRTVAWRELAKPAGYKNAEAVKLQYGTLARRISNALGIFTPVEGFWLHTLADWGPGLDALGHTTFELRPQMVIAMKQLGLHQPRPVKRPKSSALVARAGANARHTARPIDFSDIPEASDAQLKSMRRVVRRPLGDKPRQLIAIRMDPDVLDELRKEAHRRRVGYQTLINQVLAEHVKKDVE